MLDSNVKLLDDTLPDHTDTEGSEITDDWGWSAYLFMTRKQLWLRRAVFDCKENFRQANSIATGSECSVIHVRRSDVVLGDERKYYPVADYIKMIPEDRLNNANHYIIILTDDLNAIKEAHKFFPNLQWAYLDRPRFKGSSGGWENQTPSRNPALETIFLLAEFELAMACSVFVHGQSGFSNFIYQHVSGRNEVMVSCSSQVSLKIFLFYCIQMVSANRNVTRYRVEDSNSTVLELFVNETESHLEALLTSMLPEPSNSTEDLPDNGE